MVQVEVLVGRPLCEPAPEQSLFSEAPFPGAPPSGVTQLAANNRAFSVVTPWFWILGKPAWCCQYCSGAWLSLSFVTEPLIGKAPDFSLLGFETRLEGP